MPNSLSESLAPVTLPDADGREIRLGSLWENQSAVIVFLRHYGGIFCREHVAQLRERESEIRAKGAAISLGDRNYAKMFQEDTGIDFPLLIDENRKAYEIAGLKQANIFHILRSDNAAARKRAKSGGHSRHKLGKNPFQLGGTFIFGPGNVDRFAHLSKTFGDNASVAQVLEALD